MKIIMASLQQESNSLCPKPSRTEDFERLYGADILTQLWPAEEVFREAGAEMIPLTFAHAVPGGTLEKESFLFLLGELLAALPLPCEADGIWLYLHGALNVEEIGSGELAILKALRERVGFDIPIAVAMDFHANLPVQIAEYANLICGYKTAPHSDMEATEALAAKGLVKMIRAGALTRPAMVKIPMMLSGDMVLTAEEPMCRVMKRAAEIAARPGILDATVFSGQSWVDAPHSGACVSVTALDEKEDALGFAEELARLFWDVRKEFRFRVPAGDAPEMLKLLSAESEGPVFLSDSGDNTTAGAAGDRTELLSAVLSLGIENILVAGITDAPFVRAFQGKPVGTVLTLPLGGTLSDSGQSIEVTAELLHCSNILSWDGLDGGPSVLVRIGTADVIVCERRCSIVSPEIIASAGADIYQYHLVVVKLGYLYPELAEVAKKAAIAFTSGTSCVAIERIPFQKINRPMYPMDPETDF
ncbi:MAG: M81 family metallopeptidase [Oscillospiraceae bacterium]|nr:M81 family metallopeptidase [Oscillospiraceae bacterium]